MCFVISESKIYTVVNIAAKSLRTIVYIILKKISKVEASSIIRNFSILITAAFVCIIPIIKLDEEEFWPCYLPN